MPFFIDRLSFTRDAHSSVSSLAGQLDLADARLATTALLSSVSRSEHASMSCSIPKDIIDAVSPQHEHEPPDKCSNNVRSTTHPSPNDRALDTYGLYVRFGRGRNLDMVVVGWGSSDDGMVRRSSGQWSGAVRFG